MHPENRSLKWTQICRPHSLTKPKCKKQYVGQTTSSLCHRINQHNTVPKQTHPVNRNPLLLIHTFPDPVKKCPNQPLPPYLTQPGRTVQARGPMDGQTQKCLPSRTQLVPWSKIITSVPRFIHMLFKIHMFVTYHLSLFWLTNNEKRLMNPYLNPNINIYLTSNTLGQQTCHAHQP